MGAFVIHDVALAGGRALELHAIGLVISNPISGLGGDPEPFRRRFERRIEGQVVRARGLDVPGRHHPGDKRLGEREAMYLAELRWAQRSREAGLHLSRGEEILRVQDENELRDPGRLQLQPR